MLTGQADYEAAALEQAGEFAQTLLDQQEEEEEERQDQTDEFYEERLEAANAFMEQFKIDEEMKNEITYLLSCFLPRTSCFLFSHFFFNPQPRNESRLYNFSLAIIPRSICIKNHVVWIPNGRDIQGYSGETFAGNLG